MNKFHVFTKRRPISIIILLVFLLLFGFSYILTGNAIDLILALIVGISYPLLIYLLLKLHVNKYVKTTKIISDETLIDFRFGEDEIELKVENVDYRSTGNMKWYQLFKAYEDKEYFSLYIGSKKSYILPKKGITTGTIEEFEQLLIEKIGKKFKKEVEICIVT